MIVNYDQIGEATPCTPPRDEQGELPLEPARRPPFDMRGPRLFTFPADGAPRPARPKLSPGTGETCGLRELWRASLVDSQ